MTEVSWIAAIVVPIGVFVLGCIAVVFVYYTRGRKGSHEHDVEYHITDVKDIDNSHRYVSAHRYPPAPSHHRSSRNPHQRVSKHSHRSNNSDHHREHVSRSGRNSKHKSQNAPNHLSKLHTNPADQGSLEKEAVVPHDAPNPHESLGRSKLFGSTGASQELKWYNRLGLFNAKDDDESLADETKRNVDAKGVKGSPGYRKPVVRGQLFDDANQQRTTEKDKDTGNSISRPNYFAVPLTNKVNEPSAAQSPNGTRFSRLFNPPMEPFPRLSVQLSTTSGIFDELNIDSPYENSKMASVQKYPSLIKNQHKSYRNSKISQQHSITEKEEQKEKEKKPHGRDTGNGPYIQQHLSHSSTSILSSKLSLLAPAQTFQMLQTKRGGTTPEKKIHRRQSSLSYRSVKSSKSLKSSASLHRNLHGDNMSLASQSYLAINKPLPEDPKETDDLENDEIIMVNGVATAVPKLEMIDTDTRPMASHKADIDTANKAPATPPVTPPQRSPLRKGSGSTVGSFDVFSGATSPSPLRIDKNIRNNSSDSSAVDVAPKREPTGKEEQKEKQKEVHLYELSPFHDIDSSSATGSLRTAHTSPGGSSPSVKKANDDDNVIRSQNQEATNYSDLTKSKSSSSDHMSKLLPDGIVAVLGEVYRVVHPYKPELEDELEVRRGEKLIIFQVFDDGWCFAKLLISAADKFPSSRQIEGICPKACLASL